MTPADLIRGGQASAWCWLRSQHRPGSQIGLLYHAASTVLDSRARGRTLARPRVAATASRPFTDETTRVGRLWCWIRTSLATRRRPLAVLLVSTALREIDVRLGAVNDLRSGRLSTNVPR